MSRIVYISGRPGAGKSSLAFPLAAELGYSLVTKDLIKEALHDAMYVPGEDKIDPAWSRRLTRVSLRCCGRSRCIARAPPRSLTAGTTHGRGTRSTRGRCHGPRWTSTTALSASAR